MNNKVRRTIVSAICLFSGMIVPAYASADAISVALANSTCDAMHKVGTLYEQRSGHQINYQCKSSGLLAKGLTGGAIAADIYVAANKEWMDYMIAEGLVEPAQVTQPWGNELVVVAAKNSSLAASAWSDLASPKIDTILIGDPGTAPFGRYAKDAMQHTALWEQVKSKITTKKHITLLAEAMAKANSSTVGIMFRSNVNENHRVLFNVDERWHEPIHYYVAPLKSAAGKRAVSDLLHFMQDEEARRIFQADGFRVYAR
ncbi:MAG: molybdate ABC transporter substrate-binding protein [Pseudomonadota bacterium]